MIIMLWYKETGFENLLPRKTTATSFLTRRSNGHEDDCDDNRSLLFFSSFFISTMRTVRICANTFSSLKFDQKRVLISIYLRYEGTDRLPFSSLLTARLSPHHQRTGRPRKREITALGLNVAIVSLLALPGEATAPQHTPLLFEFCGSPNSFQRIPTFNCIWHVP